MSKSKYIPKSENQSEEFRIGNYLSSSEIINSFLTSMKTQSSNHHHDDENDLGDGYYLKQVDQPKEFNGKKIEESHHQFFHLYKDEKKLSDRLFRIGGLTKQKPFESSDFMEIICYEPGSYNYDKSKKIHMTGNHVIIDKSGQIVLKAQNSFDYPSVIKGCIGKIKDNFYDLRTGKKIAEKNYGPTIDTGKSIILSVETDYNEPTKVIKIRYSDAFVEEIV